jgi:hypothetical protein
MATKTPAPKVRVYTTRKLPLDLLKRMRLVAAMLSVERDKRVTIEQVVNEALAYGVPRLESEAFGDK